eukprot:6065402-Ditylum_brightwellii.AAC.1
MEQCCLMVLTMVLRLLTSTLYISHKQLIVVGRIETCKKKHLVCNEEDDIDYGADDGDDDSVGNGDDDGADD